MPRVIQNAATRGVPPTAILGGQAMSPSSDPVPVLCGVRDDGQIFQKIRPKSLAPRRKSKIGFDAYDWGPQTVGPELLGTIALTGPSAAFYLIPAIPSKAPAHPHRNQTRTSSFPSGPTFGSQIVC